MCGPGDGRQPIGTRSKQIVSTAEWRETLCKWRAGHCLSFVDFAAMHAAGLCPRKNGLGPKREHTSHDIMCTGGGKQTEREKRLTFISALHSS